MIGKTFFRYTTAALAISTASLFGVVMNRAEGDKNRIEYYRTELKNNLPPAEFNMIENRCNRFCRTLGAKADAYETAMQIQDCKASYNRGMLIGTKKATTEVREFLVDSLNKEATKTNYKSYQKGLVDGVNKYRKSLNVLINDTVKTVTPDSIATALGQTAKQAAKFK